MKYIVKWEAITIVFLRLWLLLDFFYNHLLDFQFVFLTHNYDSPIIKCLYNIFTITLSEKKHFTKKADLVFVYWCICTLFEICPVFNQNVRMNGLVVKIVTVITVSHVQISLYLPLHNDIYCCYCFTLIRSKFTIIGCIMENSGQDRTLQ